MGGILPRRRLHATSLAGAGVQGAGMAPRRWPGIGAPSKGGPFMRDTFTDTNGTLLVAHTGETKHTWLAQTGYTTVTGMTIQSNRIVNVDVNQGVYRTNAIPPSPNYYVEGDIFCVTASADNVGVAGRMQADAQTLYFARFLTSFGWQLYKTVAGASAQLGSNYADAGFTVGVTRKVRLTMMGSTISASVDGVTFASVTDTDIAAAGFAGIRSTAVQSNTTGYHIDNVLAA